MERKTKETARGDVGADWTVVRLSVARSSAAAMWDWFADHCSGRFSIDYSDAVVAFEDAADAAEYSALFGGGEPEEGTWKRDGQHRLWRSRPG